MAALKDAAFNLKAGRSGQVRVDSEDEMADLAHAFNAMAISIEDRERDITRLAKTDTATDLPNRSAFEDYITSMRDRSGENGRAEQQQRETHANQENTPRTRGQSAIASCT